MKKFTTLLILIIFINKLYSQDKIVLLNSNIIEAGKIEIEDKSIKYNKFDNLNGATYSIKSNEVEKIIFANGTQEKITEKSTTRELNNKSTYLSFGTGLNPFFNNSGDEKIYPLVMGKVDFENNGLLRGGQISYKSLGSGVSAIQLAFRVAYLKNIRSNYAIYGGGDLGINLIFGGPKFESTFNPGLFFGVNSMINSSIGMQLEFKNQFGTGKATTLGTNISDLVVSLIFKI